MLWSRMLRHLAAPLCLAVFLSAATRAAEPQNPGDVNSSAAAQLVRQALEAERAGDAEERSELLEQALKVDANYAPAHWQQGELRVGGEWLTIDEATAAMNREGKVEQYRSKRDRVARTADAHMALARWCASAGLKGQERIHLMCAMNLRPSHSQQRDIVTKLGLVSHQGMLVPQGELAAHEREVKARSKSLKDWKPRLDNLVREAGNRNRQRRQSALEEISAIRDPGLAPGLEQILAGPTNAEVRDDVRAAVFRSLSEMKDTASTDSLVRVAMFHNEASVRAAAARALKSKSFFGYMPTLMGALESRVDVQFQMFFVNGIVRHRLSLYQAGPMVDRSISLANGAALQSDITMHPASGRPPDGFSQLLPDTTLGEDMERGVQERVRNADRERWNLRLADVLATVSDQNFGPDPRAWWNWWQDYNETYRPPENPVVTNAYDQTPLSFYRVRFVSCFVAGTRVWTLTGPMAIEDVVVGESVLAQNPETGELAYKPVMATTVRPSSPVIEVRAGSTTITATRGHPFWVSGLGWQMAKELKAGQHLHTPGGPLLIEGVQSKGAAECYNLVVADFNSYFVSDAQVLVHDNLLRQVTTATVPGLSEP